MADHVGIDYPEMMPIEPENVKIYVDHPMASGHTIIADQTRGQRYGSAMSDSGEVAIGNREKAGARHDRMAEATIALASAPRF